MLYYCLVPVTIHFIICSPFCYPFIPLTIKFTLVSVHYSFTHDYLMVYYCLILLNVNFTICSPFYYPFIHKLSTSPLFLFTILSDVILYPCSIHCPFHYLFTISPSTHHYRSWRPHHSPFLPYRPPLSPWAVVTSRCHIVHLSALVTWPTLLYLFLFNGS